MLQNFLRWNDQKFPILIFLLAIILPGSYIVFRKPELTFWDNTIGNLTATVVALIAGIPIALIVDRKLQKEKIEQEQSILNNKENKLLTLIKEELNGIMQDFLSKRKGIVGSYQIEPLKTDLWSVVIASGEIGNIHDIGLLSAISGAYTVVNYVKDIEKLAYIAANSATVTFKEGDGTTTALKRLVLQARSFDSSLEIRVSAALTAIEKYLEFHTNIKTPLEG